MIDIKKLAAERLRQMLDRARQKSFRLRNQLSQAEHDLKALLQEAEKLSQEIGEPVLSTQDQFYLKELAKAQARFEYHQHLLESAHTRIQDLAQQIDRRIAAKPEY